MSDCVGVESVGSRFFKPVSKVDFETAVRVSVSEVKQMCHAQLCWYVSWSQVIAAAWLDKLNVAGAEKLVYS